MEVSRLSLRKARSSSGSVRRYCAGLPSRSSFSASTIERRLGFLVVALGVLGEVVDALLEALEIGQHQLGLDRLGVAIGESGPRHG